MAGHAVLLLACKSSGRMRQLTRSHHAGEQRGYTQQAESEVEGRGGNPANQGELSRLARCVSTQHQLAGYLHTLITATPSSSLLRRFLPATPYT
jgi:hypothetical protein